jgi:anti-sigma B factor antagonist
MAYNVAISRHVPLPQPMRLSLNTRDVGRVTIVHCSGRLVAGDESESLRAHVAWLLRDRRAIVLHLGEVAFVDSSGLGTMVRTLTSTRQVHGDLKLCNVPDHVLKVLELSHLTKLFETHESEENAVAAFYQPRSHSEAPAPVGRSVLCVAGDVDVLAYLRELLRRAGYDIHTTNHVRDAMILMRITRFDFLVLGADIKASPVTRQAFQSACAGLPVIELDGDFSTCEAGEAGAGLLGKIDALLRSKSA